MQQPTWLAPNYTEPRVLVTIPDLCAPGSTVFDVGANFGGITLGMSRAVGPKGAVCAFEANPSISKRCQDFIVESGCGNVQLYHGAIYKESGQSIDLYLSDNQVADSIYYRVSDRKISVPTIALDDFVDKTGLIPSFVKMDIEGAEHDALVGFERSIAAHKPVFILEQTPSEKRCLAFLQSYGYVAVDLSTYEIVTSMDDLPPETSVTDILFAQPAYLEKQGYTRGTVVAASLEATDFDRTTESMIVSKPISIPAGRYSVTARYSGNEADSTELMCGVLPESGDEPIMQHHGMSATLSYLAHRWIFESKAREVRIFFRFIGLIPASFVIEGISLKRVEGLSTQVPIWK